MKQTRRLLAGTALILLTTSMAWAGVGNGKCPPGNPDPTKFPGCGATEVSAPEVDPGFGTSAIVLVVGTLLIVAERVRRGS